MNILRGRSIMRRFVGALAPAGLVEEAERQKPNERHHEKRGHRNREPELPPDTRSLQLLLLVRIHSVLFRYRGKCGGCAKLLSLLEIIPPDRQDPEEYERPIPPPERLAEQPDPVLQPVAMRVLRSDSRADDIEEMLLLGNLFEERMLARIHPPVMREESEDEDKRRDEHHPPPRRVFYFVLPCDEPGKRVDAENGEHRQEKERKEAGDGVGKEERPAVEHVARRGNTGEDDGGCRMRASDADIPKKETEEERLQVIALLLNHRRCGAGIGGHPKTDESDFAEREKIRESTGDKVEPVLHDLKRRAECSDGNLSHERCCDAIRRESERDANAERKRNAKSPHRTLPERERHDDERKRERTGKYDHGESRREREKVPSKTHRRCRPDEKPEETEHDQCQEPKGDRDEYGFHGSACVCHRSTAE